MVSRILSLKENFSTFGTAPSSFHSVFLFIIFILKTPAAIPMKQNIKVSHTGPNMYPKIRSEEYIKPTVAKKAADTNGIYE
jgi:hypothetical protein